MVCIYVCKFLTMYAWMSPQWISTFQKHEGEREKHGATTCYSDAKRATVE
jgi:hypothetical protein